MLPINVVSRRRVVFLKALTGLLTVFFGMVVVGQMAHAATGSPIVQLGATSLTFGPQTAGTRSNVQLLVVTNAGTAPLIFTSQTAVGSMADDFLVLGCGSSVEPNDSCTIQVYFTPVSVGAKSAQLRIFDNAAGPPQVVNLAGTATALATVSISTSIEAFGTQAVGTAGASKTVTLSNTTTKDANLFSIAIVGAQADDFALVSHCGVLLAPSSSCSVSIKFWPVSVGTKTATLNFAIDGSNLPLSVKLTGTGAASSNVVVSSASLTFAGQPVKSSSLLKRLTLTNFSSSPVAVHSIAVSGPQADDFTQANTCGSSLAAGASCDIDVKFEPVSTGTKSAVLQIVEGIGPSTLQASLGGSGIPLPSFSLVQSTNTAVQVHSTDTGSIAVTARFAVVNSSTQPLTPTLVEQMPAGGSSVVDNYSFQTQSARTIVLTVTLKPGVDVPLGVHTETLLISLCVDPACTTKIGGSPQSVALSYEVLATEGHDYTQQIFPLNANSVTWNSKLGLFCVLRGYSPESLSLVDPDTGSVTASIVLPSEAVNFATSDDGQFAYVAFQSGNIARYKLPSLALDITIPLAASESSPQIAVAPGSAHTLAVLKYDNETGIATVMVYDDAVMRKNIATTPYSDLTWGGDASTLYALGFGTQIELFTFNVSADGLTQQSLDTDLGDFAGNFHYAAGLLYSDTGYVFDPSQHMIVGEFPLLADGRIVPDATLGRAFIWWPIDSTIHSEDLSLLTNIAEAQFTGIDEAGGPLIRWGASGLAFVTYEGNLLVIQGSFVNPSASFFQPTR